jgi:hypothetical protein
MPFSESNTTVKGQQNSRESVEFKVSLKVTPFSKSNTTAIGQWNFLDMQQQNFPVTLVNKERHWTYLL